MTRSRRVYPLDPRKLTEEQLAVAFAMTSRRPEPFDEIAEQVSEEKAASFHERWVLGYGHASVAEHAILHMAVENISRLAADTLEDNRLASYTEKSSRYQLIDSGDYYVPSELNKSKIREIYVGACEDLFSGYQQLVENICDYLSGVRPREDGERDGAYNLRLRREATDSCRFLLPASTLTNIGVTINARSLEHAITKLLSSDLVEEQELGEELKIQGRSITPTLVKYADYNAYIAQTREAMRDLAISSATHEEECDDAKIVHFDALAEQKIVAALLYRFSDQPYEDIWRKAEVMSAEQRESVINESLKRIGPHDAPLRELELVDYVFDLTMDYGAYREFKRHRMQSYVSQPLTTKLGYLVPPLIDDSGQRPFFEKMMEVSHQAYLQMVTDFPEQAQYIVTHAHYRRILAKMNLRECYHLFQLRTGPQAHFSLQKVMRKAMEAVITLHPVLFRYIQLRGS